MRLVRPDPVVAADMYASLRQKLRTTVLIRRRWRRRRRSIRCSVCLRAPRNGCMMHMICRQGRVGVFIRQGARLCLERQFLPVAYSSRELLVWHRWCERIWNGTAVLHPEIGNGRDVLHQCRLG